MSTWTWTRSYDREERTTTWEGHASDGGRGSVWRNSGETLFRAEPHGKGYRTLQAAMAAVRRWMDG